MPSQKKQSESRRAQDNFWEKCSEYCPELKVPGYWDIIEENAHQWADDVTISPFWKEVELRRTKWSNEFSRKCAGSLLSSPQLPKFQGKRKERIKSKVAERIKRKEERPAVVWPKDGSPVPKINDLVRTRVTCSFLDGVEYFTDQLEQLANERKIENARIHEGRLEGYFAQHFYFDCDVFFRFGGVNTPTTIKCEIQVATILSTRIWQESHATYEQWRGQHEQRQEWQWNPKDPRFISRQLGHMIHLADGLLVQLRDASEMQKRTKS